MYLIEDWVGFGMNDAGGNTVQVLPALGFTLVVTTTNFDSRDARALTRQLIHAWLLPAVLDRAQGAEQR